MGRKSGKSPRKRQRRHRHNVSSREAVPASAMRKAALGQRARFNVSIRWQAGAAISSQEAACDKGDATAKCRALTATRCASTHLAGRRFFLHSGSAAALAKQRADWRPGRGEGLTKPDHARESPCRPLAGVCLEDYCRFVSKHAARLQYMQGGLASGKILARSARAASD